MFGAACEQPVERNQARDEIELVGLPRASRFAQSDTEVARVESPPCDLDGEFVAEAVVRDRTLVVREAYTLLKNSKLN